MTRLRNSGAAAILALAVLALPASAQGAAAPKTKKCANFKKKAAKQRCLKQNQANRVAFNQIKDSKFVGQRGDGQYVEHFFCADGKFEARTESSSSTGVSKGTSWWVTGAVVKQGGGWVNAFLGAPGGFEIALQRRGAQWKVAVASLGRILYPGDVVKSRAADCS